MKVYLAACMGAMLLATILTPLIIRLSRVLGVVDTPGVRRIHRQPIPRIGGLAVAAATLMIFSAAVSLDGGGTVPYADWGRLAGLLAGAATIFVVGIADDLLSLRARTKLAGQILAALMVVAAGGVITSVQVGQYVLELGLLSGPLTVLWIVGITNAVNLIDGMDGVAAGVGAMACLVLAIFALYTGQPVIALLMFALLGGVLGFLLFNFNPAKVFLGDGGALFIGFLLAGGSVLTTARTPTLAALSLAVLTLALPIFDMLFSILRRTLERRSIFAADRNHIHHHLLARGMSQRAAALFIYLITFIAACGSLLMMVLAEGPALLVLGLAVAFMLALFRGLGAVRLRDSWDKLQADLALARQARQQRHCFEQAQLRLREAETSQDWWAALCEAAEQMSFLWMRCRYRAADGTRCSSIWRRTRLKLGTDRIVRGTIPTGMSAVDGASCSIDLAVAVNGHLEDAGRRMTLFARLIDENGALMLFRPLRQSPGEPRSRYRRFAPAGPPRQMRQPDGSVEAKHA